MVVVKGDIKRSEHGYLIPKNVSKNQYIELKVTDIQEEYGENFSGEVKLVFDRDSINRNNYIILKIIPNEHDGILAITSGGIVTHHPEGTGIDKSYPNTRIGRLKRLEKR